MYRWVFLVLYFCISQWHPFLLFLHQPQRKSMRNIFTASLKHCCPAQESMDRHQKLVSINALCYVVMLHHIFWWVRMCRVTTPGYRDCQTNCPFTGPKYDWFGMCSLFYAVCIHVLLQVYAYINYNIFSREDLRTSSLFHASSELHFNLVHIGI